MGLQFGEKRSCMWPALNRSVDVIKEVMADHQAEVWVSDVYSAQIKARPRERQLCMAHQLRNLQAVIDLYPQAFWPKAMQVLFPLGGASAQ